MAEPGSVYTAFFCEENIWQLLHSRREQGQSLDGLEVVFISNRGRQVALGQQRAARIGAYIVWDYHVILVDRRLALVFDLDTRLACPVSAAVYLAATLPDPRLLDGRYIPGFRLVPAADYLERFCSDRSHMLGRLPPEQFPGWPPIQPPSASHCVRLDQYWDVEREIQGTRILSQVEFQHYLAGAKDNAPQSP